MLKASGGICVGRPVVLPSESRLLDPYSFSSFSRAAEDTDSDYAADGEETPFSSPDRFHCDEMRIRDKSRSPNAIHTDKESRLGSLVCTVDSLEKDYDSSRSGSECDSDEDEDEEDVVYGTWSSSEDDDSDFSSSSVHRASPHGASIISPDQALQDPLFVSFHKQLGLLSPTLGMKKLPFSGAKTPAAKLKGEVKRERHNSTNTCLVSSVIPAPIIDDLVHCVSYVIHLHVQWHTKEKSDRAFYDLFDENRFPLNKRHSIQTEIPSVDDVCNFLLPIFHSERLGAEICVMMLAYIERVMTWKNIAMLPNTWRRVCLGALILASKVWEDQSVWNVDFIHCFDNVSSQDLGKLERDFLNLIEFNVGLKASVYVKYFISLQEYSKQPRLPETSSATRLEYITHEKQAEMKIYSSRKTNSASSLPSVPELM